MPPIRALFCLSLVLSACASAPAPIVPATPPPAPKPENLVDCLVRKGVHLYGASWCHWCHVQLEKFGPDASKIPYTDCDPKGDLELLPECKAQGIEMDGALPMWVFPGMGRLAGVRAPAVIAQVAGCPLPP